MLEMLVTGKYSNLLDPFVSYVNNEVLYALRSYPRTLDWAGKPAMDKHSSLLKSFISCTENEVL
jgi:hypothetical protein